MTADNFDQAFTLLLGNEGGYVNNPNDPGGETMWGITKSVAVANGYVGAMKDLPQATARAIAKKVYWDPYALDNIPFAIAFQVFDTAYNGGKPVQWLQQSLGVPADGVMGPATLAAVNKANAWQVVARFSAYRLKYYTGLTTWSTFGKGWTTRVIDNLLRTQA
jgi:lysozyme family protein